MGRKVGKSEKKRNTLIGRERKGWGESEMEEGRQGNEEGGS